MNRFAFLAACVLLFAVAQAQVNPRKPAPPAQPLGPQLIVHDTQKDQPLAIASADIRVAIVADLAETTMTLTFSNPNDRVLEGELRFPLPEGATVSGYGLDVNGEMVDGVPVEKNEARVVFETEVRKGVDPGLMEHVAGNNYRTRVYPIPARGQRTVKVQYISDLIHTPQGLNYILPLKWDQSATQLKLQVEIAKPLTVPSFRGLPENKPKVPPVSAPAVPSAENEPNPLATTNQQLATHSVLYSRTYNNIRFNDDLTISIPNAPVDTSQRVSIAKRTQSDGQSSYYFLASDRHTMLVEPPLRAQPQHIAIFWDCSLSRSTTDLSREIALIHSIAQTAGSRSQIDVIRFSDKPQAVKTFTIGDRGDTTDLLDFIKSTVFDGGTDLSALKIPDGCAWAVLFTDGLANLGGPLPEKYPVPVYVLTGDSRASHGTLETIAIRSGGTYINLNRYEDAAVKEMIGVETLFLVSVKVTSGKVADLTPSYPQLASGRVIITGRLLSESATLTLNYGSRSRILDAREIQLRQSDAVEGRLVPRAWAQRRIAELSMDETKNHNAILDLGREFGIVTSNTSLLVLETLQQYIQYNITPPRSRADMYAAYVKHVETNTKAEETNKAAKIDNVVAQWNARVQWWSQRLEWWEQRENFPKDVKGMEPLPIKIPKPGYSGTPRSLPPGMVLVEPNQPAMARQYPNLLEYSATDRVAGKKSTAENTAANTASIQIKPWDTETPYLIRLRLAKPADAYNVYLKERTESASPAFYLDCANFFIQKNQRDIGIRVLTNIAELELDSPALLRVAAYRLAQIGEFDLAIILFEKVLALRPEEPQIHRDLALALIARGENHGRDRLGGDRSPSGPSNGGFGETALPANDYIRALGLLHHVVMHDWDRFPGIEVIALMEANRLIARLDKLPQAKELNIPFDRRLIKLLDCEVRVVLTWDSDLTDMDLWVTDPLGEKCFYSHNRTAIGGLISNDFTQGYGPEEYCLRRAEKGQYKIQANFYGSRQQSLSGPTTLQAEVITNFGRPNEKRQAITLRLEKSKEVVDVGTVTIE